MILRRGEEKYWQIMYLFLFLERRILAVLLILFPFYFGRESSQHVATGVAAGYPVTGVSGSGPTPGFGVMDPNPTF